MKTDPFTRTPGVAGDAYIDMHYADKVLQSFQNKASSKYVFKIVGLRGSGKSVAYRKIFNALSQEPGWRVYTLSAAGDPINTLITNLSKEPFINDKTSSMTVTSGGVLEANAWTIKDNADVGISQTIEKNTQCYSQEATLSKMIDKANASGYRVLVGVDDIAKTPEMGKFLSLWGAMLLEDSKKIYLVCTGLAKNIEEFADESNLTFFKRSDCIEVGALDKFEIAAMYQRFLDVNETEATKLSKFTCGYAYAYQDVCCKG